MRGEEVPIDGDIVINFGERTKSKLKIGHYPPLFFYSTRSSQLSLVRVCGKKFFVGAGCRVSGIGF
ncbi:MAG: hypothetical protein DWQ51_10015 [Microcystis wesenbergii TW10]|uniref:Uncharacterized protein n=1 Tax=Microcystis wesenbergii TW10 TaxID=2060474 RepID=A0A3E0LZ89_9CHRO|nr:MAG: hypothetical protein DWQ51_10015 [Microcystis wesenbergii TW10]